MQVFFIKDGIMFPDLVHSLRPNPKTHSQEGWRILDFLGNYPESTLMVCPALPCFATALYSTPNPASALMYRPYSPSVLMYIHTLLLPSCTHLPHAAGTCPFFAAALYFTPSFAPAPGL